jgi:asparagine synthase (glutamine-hydrolysing)
MCGIAGFLDPARRIDDPDRSLAGMGGIMRRRGPDAEGSYRDDAAGLGLVHRRLSILDLSPTGAQPMVSASGRYVVSFNGEIYNFPVLRRELEDAGASFRGTSDTEVLLAGVEAWGLEETLRRANGMFAFALWDARDRRLALVRDRLGIKPLFYGFFGGVCAFASDPNCFDFVPGFTGAIDRGALVQFLRHGFIPAHHAIFEGVSKLPPGQLLEVGADASEASPRSWWSVRRAVEQGRTDPFRGTPEEAVDRLEELLRGAVRRRMVADVPLGAFLSGGVDSSTVVALMQGAGEGPVKTFSIGFEDERFDEAGFARAVADHLGTDHTSLVQTPAETRAVIPDLPAMFAEPFADASQIPTFLVSRLARRDVTVSLSGDGGDELFAGYHTYAMAAALRNRVARVPLWARRTGATLVRALPVGLWDAAERHLPAFDSGGRAFNLSGDRMHKLAGVVRGRDFAETCVFLKSIWEDPAGVVRGGREDPTALDLFRDLPGAVTGIPSMQAWDQRLYLPDDILVKVDRASMAVGLEARVPILDHTVVEFSWSLPPDFMNRDGRTKWPLRRVLDRHVPRHLIDRPKQGFSVPIVDWLRGPLKDWAGDLLSPDRLGRDGVLRPGPVARCWDEFQSGKRNWQHRLWGLLMFQAWLDHRRERRGTP